MTANTASPWPGLRLLSNELFEASDDFEEEFAAAVLREVPFYRGGIPISDETLHQACATHMDFILNYPNPGSGDAELIRALGADRARDQVPLVPVLDALRACTQYLWQRITCGSALLRSRGPGAMSPTRTSWMSHPRSGS